MLSHEIECPIVGDKRPAKIVIIGFGSPIRGDDAFGPLVADKLIEELQYPEVEIFSRHILTAEMAESLRDATLVLFIDASIEGAVGRSRSANVDSKKRCRRCHCP